MSYETDNEVFPQSDESLIRCDVSETFNTSSDEIVLGTFPQADGSVVKWVYIHAYTVEHDDGSIQFIPAYVDCRHVYPNVDEF